MTEFYRQQSRFTDPGPMADWLADTPSDVAGIREVAAKSVFHFMAHGDVAGHGFTDERKPEISLRYAADMFARLRELDPTPPGAGRATTDRILGNCRDFTVLFLSMARHHGIPARARVGFATYFWPGTAGDHVVAEVWEGDRWRLVEPQLDIGYVDPADGTVLDLLDVPRDKFLVGADAWTACRSGGRHPNTFAVAPDVTEPFLRGWSYLRHNLVFDLAALNGQEPLLWDLWGVLVAHPEGDAERLDTLAALLRDPATTTGQLRAAYDTEDFRVPDTVTSRTPPTFAPEQVTLRRTG
jgi:hypothetical protein